MKSISTILLVGTALFALLSFNQNSYRKYKKALNEGYTFVPSGNLAEGESTTSIQSFIMFQGEVTNIQYKEFLYDLKKNGETEKLKVAEIDSTLWSTSGAFLSAFEKHYASHPAYDNYPVVNISKEAAQLYCDWLSKRFMPNMDGVSNLKFRLPTHQEWIHAANGGLSNATYSWGGPYLRNSKGCILANFVRFGAEHIARDSSGNFYVERNVPGDYSADGADVTAPSKSYWPNGYGLYNMNGNVAEMIGDKEIVAGGSWRDPGFDVRNLSSKPYSGAATNVGFRVVATAKAQDVPWMKIK